MYAPRTPAVYHLFYAGSMPYEGLTGTALRTSLSVGAQSHEVVLDVPSHLFGSALACTATWV